MSNPDVNDWTRRGMGFLNSIADFGVGVGQAFKEQGKRMDRGKYGPFIEALCAVVGDLMTQNGRIKSEEVQAFKKFAVDNSDVPAIKAFTPDEMVDKARKYAHMALDCEEAGILAAIRPMVGTPEGELLILAAIVIAYADGDCDKNEQRAIVEHATTLRVDPDVMKNHVSSVASGAPLPAVAALPSPAGPINVTPAPAISGPAVGSVSTDTCTFCKGTKTGRKGRPCNFCKRTGVKQKG